MKLPPDVEFYEDIRLLIYRPHGSMNEEAVNKIVSVIGDLEAMNCVLLEPETESSNGSHSGISLKSNI